MTTIAIQDNKCWKCGEEFNNEDEDLKMTIHHCLPESCEPKNNITIPIHKKCHKKITSFDLVSLTSFAFKLTKQQEQLKMAIFELNNLLSNKFMFDIKK